jgi:hypothetical protein
MKIYQKYGMKYEAIASDPYSDKNHIRVIPRWTKYIGYSSWFLPSLLEKPQIEEGIQIVSFIHVPVSVPGVHIEILFKP